MADVGAVAVPLMVSSAAELRSSESLDSESDSDPESSESELELLSLSLSLTSWFWSVDSAVAVLVGGHS